MLPRASTCWVGVRRLMAIARMWLRCVCDLAVEVRIVPPVVTEEEPVDVEDVVHETARLCPPVLAP